MLRPLGCSQVNRTDSTSPRTVENGAASDSENQISRKRPATDTPYEHSSLSNADFGGSIKRQASPDSPAPESEPLTAVRPLLDDSFENTDLDDELLRCVDDAERDAQTTATSTNSSTSFFPKVSRSRELKVLEADGDHCETRLKCSCFSTGSIVLVSLRGLWAHTAVKVGAKIRVFGPNIGLNSKDDDVIIIDDYSGLLVYDPDTLVPCTTVTSGVFCRRKAVLSDRFKGGCGAPSKQMFVGTIVHELFQSAIRRRPKFLTESWLIGEVRRSILSSTGYVEQLVGMRLSPAELEKEIKPYLRPIVTWIHKYMPPPLGQAQGLGAMRIEEVRDIEENIWCPTFGVRGKIDVSLKMTTGDQSVATISPLELKTGKSSNSADHRAQVLLYCLMLSSLTNNEEECTGNLLYLRDGETFPVTLTPASLNGVMQMRNDLAFQLADLIDDNERVTAMPAPFVDVRSCQNCEQLVNCCLYQRTFEKDANTASDSMAALATAVLASVTDLHVAYFERWVRWICLEWTQSMKSKLDKRDTWLQPAVERESKGECLSSLVVESVTSCNNQQTAFIIAFKRQDGSALCSNIISKGELVVASVESKKMFACLMGSVVEISDSHISIQSDKPLRDSSGIFRIDKYESFATFQYNLSNLTRLMQSDLASVRLRELLIDRRAPSFGKMSKQEMEVVRTIVRGLNREQISAVVKVLVAHDYVLIKGLPGSGKTSTIVALVRCLRALGKSVLISAYTHSAVDNVLIKLLQHPDISGDSILRLGSRHQIKSECAHLTLSAKLENVPQPAMYDSIANIYSTVPVVAATCLQAANHLLFGSRRFDYVIIDEATLSLQSACLGPLLVADRFVLVGDPKQLRPIVQCRTARQEGMGDTLFEQLEERNESAVVCLRHQYRMNSEIARLSSELFYNGELQCASDSIASSTLTFAGTKSPPADSPLWIRAALKTVLESSVLFVDTRSTDADRLDYRASNDGPGLTCNRGEAAAVLRLCDALIQAGVKASDVGVICIYRHQTNVIRKALCSTDIEVNTADQYQGRDKAVIIVSLVWTAPIDDENKKSDLLIDERRVNVALTRAKQKLILLGCRHSVVRHKVIADLLNIMRPDQLCTLE